MGVRADDRRDLAVEVPAHRDLLGRRFRVEVDEDDFARAAQRLDLAQDDRERVVELQHEHAAHDVDRRRPSGHPRVRAR